MISTRCLLTALSTLLVCGCALLPAAAPAAQVPVGEAPRPPAGATSLGAVAPQRELNLHVALEPRDPAGLETFAAEVSTPGSPVYGQYLSVEGFAGRFGATPSQVATVRAALQARGLAVGEASANNLSLPVEATAAEAEAAFGTTLERFRTADDRVAFANTSAPEVPAVAAPYVAGVLGLDDLNVPTDAARKHVAYPSSDGSVPGSAAPRTAGATAALTGGPQPCTEAIDTQTEEESGYTADQIASTYSLTGYYAAGNLGAGQTVALLELEPFLPADITHYQACYGTHTAVEAVNVEGGPGTYENGDGGESELDIEQLIGLVPQADIVVYQGPNSSTPQIISTWVTEDRAKVMSSSWGLCEAESEPAEMTTVGTLLQEAAAQGQSFFVAAGDAGATDCFESKTTENKAITVDYPGSDPFAIDVGGTRLEQPTTPPIQYIWSDEAESAGGGGVSSHFAMPSYQTAADPSLMTINPYSTGAPCGAASGYCRQVPDVSADADPYTAYIVYDEKRWQIVGGTSAAAPLWAAFAALANASPACGGKTIGFANPALYAIGGSAYDGNFDDITSARPSGPKSNDMFDDSLPFFPGPHYDMTTGIGTPIGTTLGASLCAIANPPAPPTPPAPSPEPAKATPATPSVQAPAPVRGHIVSSSLSGVGQGRPRLAIVLAARPGALLRSIAIALPPTLKAKVGRGPRPRGIIVRASNGKRLAASARGAARTIRIHLSKARPSVKVVVRAPALIVAPKLLTRVRSGRAAKLSLVIAVRESGGRSARLPLQVQL